LDAAIPLKDRLLIELVRGAILWSVWLERNRVIFKEAQPKTPKALGISIISLATFWCKSKGNNSFFKLTLILPCDVNDLLDPIQEDLEEEWEVLFQAEDMQVMVREEDIMERCVVTTLECLEDGTCTPCTQMSGRDHLNDDDTAISSF
jgi:hypothetical protein